MDNGSPPPESVAPTRLYKPRGIQVAVFAAIAALALGGGFYVRYQLIEQAGVGIACQTGSASTACSVRSSAILIYEHSVFGVSAVTSSLLNLIRPSVVFIAITLLAGGLGIVLYNVALSALALTLLIFCLARPIPGRD
jgi:hypothetical protein